MPTEPIARLMNTKKILLVEDDYDIAELIKLHLIKVGAFVEHVDDGIRGFSLALQQDWDLILLDLNLPGCDGTDICKEVRSAKPLTPIILVSARSTESERVVGFDCGADDYITKPFSTLELVARTKAVLRRCENNQRDSNTESSMTVNDIKIDTLSREVTVAGKIMSFTAKEYELFFQFANSPNQVFNRTDLLDRVWGHSYEGYHHTVNTHINRLRQKIEPDPSNPKYIKTVWGVGYKFCP